MSLSGLLVVFCEANKSQFIFGSERNHLKIDLISEKKIYSDCHSAIRNVKVMTVEKNWST